MAEWTFADGGTFPELDPDPDLGRITRQIDREEGLHTTKDSPRYRERMDMILQDGGSECSYSAKPKRSRPARD